MNGLNVVPTHRVCLLLPTGAAGVLIEDNGLASPGHRGDAKHLPPSDAWCGVAGPAPAPSTPDEVVALFPGTNRDVRRSTATVARGSPAPTDRGLNGDVVS